MTILFVHNHLSSFVQIDRDLLNERWPVYEWYQAGRGVNLIDLRRAIQRSDLVFGWFASWHTFWPVLIAHALRKPIVMVMGGYDTANLPEIGYGHQRGGVRKKMSRAIAARADRLIVNSHYSRREIYHNLNVPLDRIQVIYHGLPDPYQVFNARPREATAVTVGNINHSNLQRKGHALFIEAAPLLPTLSFELIGEAQDQTVDQLKRTAASNVVFAGRLGDEALHEKFQRAAVYVQVSLHEAFGLAVAEAMLGGCIPVVSRAGALPEVVGATGVYIDQLTPAVLADSIRSVLDYSDRDRLLARQRVLDVFPISKRREVLHTLISEVLHV